MNETIILMKKWALVAAVLVGLTGLTACGNSLNNKDFEKVVEKTEAGYEIKEEVKETLEKKVTSRSVDAVLSQMHKMANSVIVADEIWGKEEITEEKVNALIVEVTLMDWVERSKQTYLDILYRWKDGDFSQADKDHNIIWGALGGTVGEAYGVNKDAIPAWAKDKKDGN